MSYKTFNFGDLVAFRTESLEDGLVKAVYIEQQPYQGLDYSGKVITENGEELYPFEKELILVHRANWGEIWNAKD